MSCSKHFFRYLSRKHILTVVMIVLCFLSFLSVNVLANSQINNHVVMDPGPDPISGGEGGTTDSVVQHIVSTVYNIVTHKILFPASTVKDALVNAFNDMTGSGIEESKDYLKKAIYSTLRWIYGKDVSRNVKLAGWKIMLIVASALMPLSLIMTVGSAMKEGVSSVTGYAAAREAITEWIISLALAGGSFYIISMLTDVSSAASYKIIDQTLSTWHIDPTEYLVGSFISAMTFNSVGAVGKLFLSLFAVFTCIAVVTSLILAVFAREVVLLLLTIISPVVFILAPIEQTKWLSGLWTKAFTFTLLLGPINIILITSGGMLYTGAIESTGVGGLLGMVIAIGVVSILITINQAVGQMIYGAAIEIANKSWDTVVGIGKAVLTVAGFAAGGSMVGAAVGGLGNSMNTNALGGMTGENNLLPSGDGGDAPSNASAKSTAPGITSRPSDDTHKMQEIFGRQRGVSNDVSNIGRTLANSGIPGLSSFGNGMQVAGAFGETKAVAGMNEVNQDVASRVMSNNSSSIQPSMRAAKSELQTAYNSLPEGRRPSQEQLDSGVNHAVAGMDAFSKVGGDMTSYLSAATGYDPTQVNDNFGLSVESTIKADASQFIGINSVSYRGMMYPAGRESSPYNWVREDQGVTAHDVRFAMDAVKSFHSSKGTDSNFIAGVAAAASSARRYGGITYQSMLYDLSKNHIDSLDNWALKTTTRFPGGPEAGSIQLGDSTMENIVKHYTNR